MEDRSTPTSPGAGSPRADPGAPSSGASSSSPAGARGVPPPSDGLQPQATRLALLRWSLDKHESLGAATEVRIIRKVNGKSLIYSGLFGPRDLDDLVGALEPLPDGPRSHIPQGDHPRDGEANIYFTLNGVRRDLYKRRPNRLQRRKTTTRDRDIHVHTLFVVDVDPVREPGTAATDREKASALAVAQAVVGWFEKREVGSILADSGNGYHVLIPVKASVGQHAVRQAAMRAKNLLRLLHRQFSNSEAEIDLVVFNPSRIIKLYGTLSVKGPNTSERPHRYSSVDLSVIPDDVDLWAAVEADLLAFEPDAQPNQSTTKKTDPNASGSANPKEAWAAWRGRALERLDLGAVYGEQLTGKMTDSGWLECRDLRSSSGDRNPSAGVADGSGQAERGSFHSFLTGETFSVFDFLMESGQAADFSEACAIIADMAGEPLPARQSKPARQERPVAGFRNAWRSAGDREAREALVLGVLKKILARPLREHAAQILRVGEITGMDRDALRQRVIAARHASHGESDEHPRAGPSLAPKRPVIEIVQTVDTIQRQFDKVLQSVLPANRLFSTGAGMVFIEPGSGPINVHERNVGGKLSSLAEFRIMQATSNGPKHKSYRVFPQELARAFVNSPAARARLPRLLSYTRSPIFDRDYNFISRPGFHHAHGIYYDGPLLTPKSDQGRLTETLSDFKWRTEVDRINLLAALLTAITMPHWGRGHPFLAINGNKPGVGKSTVARVVGVLVEGHEPSTITFTRDEAELEKQLATRVAEGDRAIVIDNVKTRGSIKSAVLERLITDTRLNFRRLGSNTAISRPQNDLLVSLTMNLTQMGGDLRRRALPVNLVLEAAARDVIYDIDDILQYTMDHRLEIVAELAGMVETWLALGRPKYPDPARHSTGQRWASTMDAILRTAGLHGLLSNFESTDREFDEDHGLMEDICAAHRDKPAAPASEWMKWAHSLLFDRFVGPNGKEKSDRGKATTVGLLFSRNTDTQFVVQGTVYQLVQTRPRSASSPYYQFKLVGQEPG